MSKMETYYWHTNYAHPNNSFTMSEYLVDHMPFNFSLHYQDDSMARISDDDTGKIYDIHASGNGDFYNHMVEFKEIID